MMLAKRGNKKDLTLCIKVKDRPFTEGSRGFHVLSCLYAQSVSAKECHVVLPLKMTTFIMKSVAFILCHPNSYNAPFSLTLNDLTYLEAIFIAFLPDDNLLEDLAQSLGRYGGHLKKIWV